MTEILILSSLIILSITQIVILLKKNISKKTRQQLKNIENSILKFDTVFERIENSIKDEFQRNRMEINEISKTNREELSSTLSSFREQFSKNVKELNEFLNQKFIQQNQQQLIQNKQSIEGIKEVKVTIDKQLECIREDNEKQLTKMRRTVDEKLQNTLEKRLGETFKQVSDRLEQVHKGLGEMQNIATGVGDLKKVLSNVKTRGVLGEYQLGNILEEILTPDQYGKNIATKKGSQANVEYAIKLPGKNTDEEIWMPIDSKFPIEPYESLLNAYDDGIPLKIEGAQKILIKAIEGFAKDISSKYIDPPNTTDFCIMFLPIESLYGEVLRHPGLFETLQRKYRITITGPTTLSALLNSLQMGFKTLAVQKRSSEVWNILSAVKAEFGKFSEHLLKVQKQLNTASGSLEILRNTRTNQIERKLRGVETLDAIVSHDNDIVEVHVKEPIKKQ